MRQLIERTLTAHRGASPARSVVLLLFAVDRRDDVLFRLGDHHVAGDWPGTPEVADPPQVLVEVLKLKVCEQYTISAQCCQWRPIPAILGFVTMMRSLPSLKARSRASFCSGVWLPCASTASGMSPVSSLLSSSVEHHHPGIRWLLGHERGAQLTARGMGFALGGPQAGCALLGARE